jgi:ubiquinone biosynthesis protein
VRVFSNCNEIRAASPCRSDFRTSKCALLTKRLLFSEVDRLIGYILASPACYDTGALRKRHTRLDMVRRLIETLAVCQGLVLRALCRRLLGRPPRGPELLREAMEKLGGAFIKLGQVASLQVELLPRAYCDALLSLLDSIPPFDRAHVERIFREELGALPETLFGNFEYTPIAAASIGQVHRGTLPDGTRVAIKVQRPDIDRVFERDCRVLEGMVRLIGVFRLRGLYFLRESVQELSAWTREELDYRREAAYCQYLGRNARNVAIAEIPRVHWEYTTSRVLVLDFLDGPSVAQYVRLTDGTGAANDETLPRLRKEGFTPEAFTSNIIANFLRDAFLFGAFHADLHPANLLILPGNVVGYVDFGIVAFLTPETRRKVVRLIRAFASGDIQGMYECILDVCTLQEGADLAAVRREMWKAGPGWYRQPTIHGRVQLRVSSTRAFLDLFATCR